MGFANSGQIENTGSGTITALNGAVTVSIPTSSTVAFNITGTWVATLTFEASTDGTNFFSILATAPLTGNSSSTTSTNGAFVAGAGGYQTFRIRASAFTSGTVSVAYNADSTPNVQGTGSVQIKGATDSALVGNISDRLKVSADVSSVPATDIIYACRRLLNGSSESMAVNGAVTPVNFDFAPGSGETWYIETIGFFLQDNGTTSPTSFGSIAGGLSNGVDVRIRSNGTEYLYTNLKNNIDLSTCFRDNYFVPGTSGLFETNDIAISEVIFRVPVVLKNSTGDYVRFRIQDNLTGLDQFKAGIRIWRTI